MIVKDFINKDFPLLTENNTVKKALVLMKDYRIEHLPVSLNGAIGVLSYESINLLDASTKLIKLISMLKQISISPQDHIWEALRSFQQMDSCIIPIINNNKEYLGVLSIWEITSHLNAIFPISTGGAILQMNMNYRNYSLAELATIVESANCKITLLSVFPEPASQHVNIVFSIDKNDATEAISALERHGFLVDSWFMNKGKIDSLLEERYNAFLKYINI